MRIFAGPWVEKILKSMGMPEGDAIESRMVTRRIEAAQKKVEERNFEIRKNLLEYDEVMDEQRKRVYRYRQRILEGANCKELILEMIRQQVQHYMSMFMARDYGVESFVRWASTRLTTEFDMRDFPGLDFEAAEILARDEAERMAETHVLDAIEENLPEEEDPQEWNWEALAKFANTRWGLNLRDRDLKKVGRDNVAEMLIEKGREAVGHIDLSDGAEFLAEDYAVSSACAWVKNKFSIDIPVDEVKDLELPAMIDLVEQRAAEAYDEKELEYPVMAGLYRFSNRVSASQSRIDRGALVAWASERFQAQLSLDDIKNKQREEIRTLLIDSSRAHQKQANQVLQEVKRKVDVIFPAGDDDQKDAGTAYGGNGALISFSDWLQQTLKFDLPAADMARLQRDELQKRVCNAVEDRFRPEIRRMERRMVLDLVDMAWKDHLLAMDHLRSAVGLVGYAQVDPKVEYKRVGMKQFEQMWDAIGQRVTDYVFRMEQLDEGYVSSTWVETAAVHEEAPGTSEIARQQEQAIQASQGGDQKVEPIRHRGKRVGRNDLCPCGSGKKYKNCCMRNSGATKKAAG
jgi:preprotein translocase subunit SecA